MHQSCSHNKAILKAYETLLIINGEVCLEPLNDEINVTKYL